MAANTARHTWANPARAAAMQELRRSSATARYNPNGNRKDPGKGGRTARTAHAVANDGG